MRRARGLPLLHLTRHSDWNGASTPFLIGFEWSDGSVSSNLPMRELHGGLHNAGGWATSQHARVVLALDRIPPSGDFSVYSAWPFFGVPENRVVLNADTIREAATRVERLWEPVPPILLRADDPPAEEEVEPALPSEGWFGRQISNRSPEKSQRMDQLGRRFQVDTSIPTESD